MPKTLQRRMEGKEEKIKKIESLRRLITGSMCNSSPYNQLNIYKLTDDCPLSITSDLPYLSKFRVNVVKRCNIVFLQARNTWQHERKWNLCNSAQIFEGRTVSGVHH